MFLVFMLDTGDTKIKICSSLKWSYYPHKAKINYKKIKIRRKGALRNYLCGNKTTLSKINHSFGEEMKEHEESSQED